MDTTQLFDLSPIEILGLTIIGEARGESITGQIAVGCVIRNRVRTHNKTYNEICLAPYQFSCWLETDPNRYLLERLAQKLINNNQLDEPIHRQCMFISSGIVNGDIIDIVHGSNYYMTKDLFSSGKRPRWADKVYNAQTIDHQIFFNI